MTRRFASLLAVAVLLSLLSAFCFAESPTLMTRHTREVTMSGQAPLVGRLPENQNMRITLILPLRDQAGLNSFLKELYDPSSPSYRHFLSVAQFTERFGPTNSDYNALIDYARANGFIIAATSRNRMNLDVTASVGTIERALHVTLGVYRHPTENRTFFAPDREPTPDLGMQLWHISGLDNYSIPKPMLVRRDPNTPRSNATTGSGPGASFLGSDMRAAYYESTALTGTGQSLGLLEYAGTDLADLNTYYKNVNQTESVPITLLSTDGTSVNCTESQGCDDTEQTIDMTQAMGMAPGLSSLVMYVGSSDTAIFNAMATAKTLNAQLSSSWTWAPADPNTDDPYFEEFSAQGQNLFQATGDSAKWTSGSEIWPADSDYLTGVGGTDLDTTSAGGPWASETAWADGGGGISPNKQPIPSWQTTLAAGCGSCSQTLRNGPDVSANANFSFYVCADQTACSENTYGGTSFAAPMWAGYLALVNEQSVANGNKTLGFINPLLYAIGESSSYTIDFHDVTSGSNGYNATTGYDLATGLGSPNGSALITALAGASGPPGFSLLAAPGSVTIAQGGSGTSTINSITTGGFNTAVKLTASGQPSGVTVAFNPTSITGTGTSTMTITVSAGATIGTYPITVTGTAGSTVETTTVTLNLTGPPNFTITASPNTLSVARGRTGTSTITTAIQGDFNAGISLTASGAGSGVTVSFNPSTIGAPGNGTATMSMHVASGAPLTTRTITVTGKGGGFTHTATVKLTVN